jgi:hypothetical protein
MTHVEPATGAEATTARVEKIEIAGLRLLGTWLLAWCVIDSTYVVVRLFVARWYPDDFAHVAYVLAEACIGWMLASRAPRIARWLRARTRVDLPA